MRFKDGKLEFNKKTGSWILSGGGGHDSWGVIIDTPNLLSEIDHEVEKLKKLKTTVTNQALDFAREERRTAERMKEWDAANPSKSEEEV